ncbi:MAG: dUTP diphosphatase [Bacilli bacterium]|nr:dUTP diphosphatase [Bacilli bacterium]
MFYNLQEIFDMQEKLDSHIHSLHNVDYENTYKKRILAFLVEIGELANETRCFKYWSLKPSSDKKIVLEEYVDGIHFVVSLGIFLKYIDREKTEVFNCKKNISMTECFLDLYNSACNLYNNLNLMTYKHLLSRFLGLGEKLGYSYNEILSAYYAKNKINYQRQENNY